MANRIKKDKTFSKDYYPVVMWRDDIEALIDVLKEAGSKVSLSTDDFEFTSLDDAAQHFGGRPQFDLKISGIAPYAQLELSRGRTNLYVGRDANSVKIFHELDEIISKAQRKPATAYHFGLLMLINFAFIGLSQISVAAAWVAPVSVILFAWFIWAGFITMRRNSVINFQRRSEARPFFERNKDQLIIFLITAVISGLLGFAGAEIKNRLSPPTSSGTK